ncbi:M23 family metallopeptidase [uncultured Shimia sp.]|uniref:M23 family metallopeptidase n=1 Tax=uncultured Shimia sp. TaxID=573152 RepID=UPI00263A38A7|nr:M23 family metallopeptidase [uncultured Shimia sp.]
MLVRTAALISALAAFPAAGAPVLEQPIDCVLGETCYIQNYVDSDPSEKWSDFACGGLSYDGHKGTDFALPTHSDIQRGVDVLAAAAGTVVGTRDGMADAILTPDQLDSVNGRECGNGVAIDHGDGWVTQYCHMKRGSILVTKGDSVATGAPLGQVGLSGKTQFPHVHMSLRHDGQVIDPFAPTRSGADCSTEPQETLWKDDPGYVAGGIIRLGFATEVPSFDDVKSGAAGMDSLSEDDPALVLFVQAFGSRTVDEISIEINGPDGFRVTYLGDVEKPKVLYFRAAGKKRPPNGWARGTYRGAVTLIRDGQAYATEEKTLKRN